VQRQRLGEGMRTTTINITVDPTKTGKWYAQEHVSKQGDTTVTFFQRDGKRSISQKFMDAIKGVRYGTELASKYAKELHLPSEAVSNIKDKNGRNLISNDQLNQLFGTTKRRMEEDIPFQKSDLLVSYVEKTKDRKEHKVTINVNETKILNEEKKIEIAKLDLMAYFLTSLLRTDSYREDLYQHLSLAIDVRDELNYSFDLDQMNAAKEMLAGFKYVTLNRDKLATAEERHKVQSNFNSMVDSLLKPLEDAMRKASTDRA
jgi:hypothetical protein